MFIITQLQPIAVLFTLPEDNLQTVSQHMAKGTLDVDAYSRDDQTKLATGKLLTIDNQIDQTTGTGRLKAVFDNKDNALWPNQFVNIRLLLEVRKNSTVIPAAAIQRGPQGSYVFVVKPDKTVEVRPVTVAFTQDNRFGHHQRTLSERSRGDRRPGQTAGRAARSKSPSDSVRQAGRQAAGRNGAGSAAGSSTRMLQRSGTQ